MARLSQRGKLFLALDQCLEKGMSPDEIADLVTQYILIYKRRVEVSDDTKG